MEMIASVLAKLSVISTGLVAMFGKHGRQHVEGWTQLGPWTNASLSPS